MVRACKPAQAFGAGVRLLARVSQHVRLQMSRQPEAFLTLWAGVGPQVGVAPPVLPQIPGGDVPAVAVRTLEGLLPGVDPLVLHQVPGLGEALVAVGAFVGSLSGVGALVVAQVRQADEAVAAHRAVVRPLPGVRPQVDLQSAAVSDLQAAVPALVGLLHGVDLGVHPQAPLGGEALGAHAALERFLGGMRLDVVVQAGLEAELLPTLGAGVLLDAGVCGQVAPEVVRPYEGLATHLALVGLLPGVDLHVLPPAAALHEPAAAVPAHEGPVARVRAHVVDQALRRAQLLAALLTLHAGVQADGLVLRLRVVGLVAQVGALTPGGLEALAAVGAAEVAPPGHHGHAVPPLAVVLQVLQVLEAAGAGRARVQPAGGRRGVGLTHVDAEVDFGVEGAAADGAGVFGDEV